MAFLWSGEEWFCFLGFGLLRFWALVEVKIVIVKKIIGVRDGYD